MSLRMCVKISLTSVSERQITGSKAQMSTTYYITPSHSPLQLVPPASSISWLFFIF